jgi:hypothetical protein
MNAPCAEGAPGPKVKVYDVAHNVIHDVIHDVLKKPKSAIFRQNKPPGFSIFQKKNGNNLGDSNKYTE